MKLKICNFILKIKKIGDNISKKAEDGVKVVKEGAEKAICKTKEGLDALEEKMKR